MNKYLEKDMQKLETMDKLRQMNLVEYTLYALLENVENKQDAIKELFTAFPKKAEGESAVQEFITKYIQEVVRDRMLVIEYIEKNKTKQMAWVFLTTHWEVVDMQLFYVAIKECAQRMGLDDFHNNDPDFMGKLYLRLLFRLIDYKKQTVTPGDVWINMLNGTLEIHENGTVNLRKHRAEDFFTYVLPYSYCPEAECPQWHAFLDRVLPEQNMQTLLAEYMGYCFTRQLKLEKMAIFYGSGSNGKSVTLEVISKLLGPSNVSNISLSALTMDDEKRSLIEGKLANISTESKGELDTAMLKQIVSGEPTEVRRLYIGTHKMTDIPKLFTSYNRLPSAEYTYGYFRRWLLFPFKVMIPENEQDVDLAKKLSTELSGILNWVLVALQNLVQKQSFTKSDVCSEALKEYVNTSNSAMLFISSVCKVDDENWTKLVDLYKSYTAYCSEEDCKRIGKKNFQEIIESLGVQSCYKHNAKFYKIKLKDDTNRKE